MGLTLLMPGQGKTNLAQRVFHDSRVRLHFHKYAWCHISQAYDLKRIRQDALENLGELLPSKESNPDLADLLRKSLKGRKYLLVLDDIWDVKAWHEMKESFPDDNNESSRTGVKKCRIHDLLHQLCLIISKKEKFLLVSEVFDRRSCCHHYRVCFHCKSRRQVPAPAALDSESESTIVSSVRTLHFSLTRHHYRFLREFKLVRVMDLTEAFVTQADFQDITQLIHLRFLAVTCWFSIPPSVVNLFKLEVLRFRYANAPIVLPVSLIEMSNLQYIFADICTILSDSGETLLDFSPLVSTNLQTLTKVVFMEESPFQSLARKIPDAQKLGLVLSFPVRLTRYFKNLESLKLSIIIVNPKLVQVKINICPSTLDFPMSIKKLVLAANDFILTDGMLSSMGKLRNLEVLKLHVHFENDRWDVEDDEFLKLKYFEFFFSTITVWNVSYESFPCLEQLVVKRCAKLGELSRRFGEIYSLKRIEVINCSDSLSDSFQEIVDALVEQGNVDLQYSIS